MQINSITSSTQLIQTDSKKTTSTNAVAASITSASVQLDTMNKASQIMKNFDLHDISHTEVLQMSRELHEAGVISFFQMAMFSAPPIESSLKLVDGKTVFDRSDENVVFSKKIDFLNNIELGLSSAEENGDESSISVMKTMVNILHNLEATRSLHTS